MYSLQVGLREGPVSAGRFLEYTDPDIQARFRADLDGLEGLHVLAMPEIGDVDSEQLAHIGKADAVRHDGRAIRFRFVRDPRFDPIPLSVIESLAEDLGISSWELRRTHWAVKDVDLFEVLLGGLNQGADASRAPSDATSAVRFPIDTPRDPRLVAVMMPFAPSFDVVYETIRAAVADAGLVCLRVDDIWLADHVMADVLSLLWRSQIVVADLSGRNANVFYELGLAHALPRATVLLTQSADDVPFDLMSIRYLLYGVGTDARATLRRELTLRLLTRMTQLSV